MNDETSPIAIATLVASVLSLIGSSTILLSYVLYSRGVGISKMIMFLALSDLGWSIVEILAFSIIISDPSLYTLDICRAARGAFQFFSSAAVMWSMCIGFFLFRNVVQSNDPNTSDQNLETKKLKQPMIIYHLISWGIPILQCAIIFIPKNGGYVTPFKSQYICLPTEPFLGAAWFLPIFLAICLSASLYTMLLFIVYKKTKSTGMNVYHQIPFRLASYVLVLLLCWVPNIIAYLEIAIAKEYESTFMSIVNGLLELQGTLDCIVYGFTNREFRNNFTGLKAPFQIILSPVILPFAFLWAVYKWIVRMKTKSIYTPILDQNASGSNPRYNNTRLMRDL